MSKNYVENTIKTHFGVRTIVHEGLRKAWNFDGKNYTAVPQGIKEKPIYVLTDLKASSKDGKTVYEAVMNECCLAGGGLASDEDMARIKAEMINGNYSSLNFLQRETFTHYHDDNGEPVFISHIMTDRPR